MKCVHRSEPISFIDAGFYSKDLKYPWPQGLVRVSDGAHLLVCGREGFQRSAAAIFFAPVSRGWSICSAPVELPVWVACCWQTRWQGRPVLDLRGGRERDAG